MLLFFNVFISNIEIIGVPPNFVEHFEDLVLGYTLRKCITNSTLLRNKENFAFFRTLKMKFEN